MPSETLRLVESEEYEGDARENPWWSWAVWLEGPDFILDGIDYVEYTRDPTFPKPVRRVYDRRTNFKLEAGGWGVFTMHAKAVSKGGSATQLKHLRTKFSYAKVICPVVFTQLGLNEVVLSSQSVHTKRSHYACRNTLRSKIGRCSMTNSFTPATHPQLRPPEHAGHRAGVAQRGASGVG
jgi:transcription initiation factor IIF auxiliary subunit